MSLPTRNKDGSLPAFTDLGGYPIFYVSKAGLALCAKCASRECDDPVVDADVHWEGEAITCDDCGAEIESAYGPIEGERP